MRIALLVVVAAILYGSLYPFDFVGPPAPLAEALSARLTEVRRGDALANLLLYIPLGLLLVVMKREGPRGGRVVMAVVLGFLLSLSVEVTQLWLPPRTTSLSDLVLNTAGSLVGAVLGLVIVRTLAARQEAGIGESTAYTGAGLFSLLLGLAFLGWQSAPFVPSIDWQAWKDSLKPLLNSPSVSVSGMLSYLAAWLAVGLVVSGLVRSTLVAPVLVVLTGVVCAAKVLVVSRVLVPEVPLSGLLIAVAWAFRPTRRLVGAPGLVAAVLAVFIAWDGLAEAWMQRTPGGSSFQWVPFRGFLAGSVFVNIQAMFEKVFLYGALVLALLRMGAPAPVVGVLSALLLMAVEGMQSFTGGRTAEITDPIIALILTAVAARMGEGRRSPLVAMGDAGHAGAVQARSTPAAGRMRRI